MTSPLWAGFVLHPRLEERCMEDLQSLKFAGTQIQQIGELKVEG